MNTETKQFLGILFPDNIQVDDLEILRKATADQPGRVRLVKAQIGKNDGATNSLPLHSDKGGKIGFVANTSLMFPPFNTTYIITQHGGKPDDNK